MKALSTSLAELLALYGATRPGEAATLRTVFKNVVLPYWRCTPAAMEAMPAHRIYGLLSDDRASWCPSLALALPSGASYQKAYCRYIKRLIAFGEAGGLLHPDQYLVSPAWRELMLELRQCTAQEPPARRSALSVAFKRLARWATVHEFAPEDLPLLEGEARPMAGFFATFPPDRDGDFYRARTAWNMLVAAAPTRGLRQWEGGRRGAIAAAPRSSWPLVVQHGLEAIFSREGLGSWRGETRKGYVHRLGGYFGVLKLVGIDVAQVVEGISDPIDALRLLFQGMPSVASQLAAAELAARLAGEPGFREEVVKAMRHMAGSYDGRACERNPFLVEAVSGLVEAGKVTSAMNLVMKAIAINRGILEVADRHIAWLTRRRALLAQLAKKQPSAYTLKKHAVFRHPYLWEELVHARGRLRPHTAALEVEWRQAVGDRESALQRRWAVALRNEVLIGLMLCYPLRVNNLVGMRLGLHYAPQAHHIFFPAAETKNDREIDYELPEGGSLGDLRRLVDQYLEEARPALLAGRRSDYFFVPDPRGGVRLREKGVNAILADLSRRFFADVLPDGVGTLNPHLLRHAAASYQLAVCQNLNLAAQLLNDSPSTITQAYADVLACKKEATKRFLSEFTLEPGRQADRPRRK